MNASRSPRLDPGEEGPGGVLSLFHAIGPFLTLHMRGLLTAVAVLASGCCALNGPSSAGLPDTVARTALAGRLWHPTPEQLAAGEQVARAYAADHLGVEPERLERMAVQPVASYREGRQELILGFFDPGRHKPLASGGYEFMRGGFPTFFTVTLDPDGWSVIRHSAERW